jgi:hypothetical protein
MDEFNAHIDETPMRKNVPVRSLKVRLYDRSNKKHWKDKDVYVNIKTHTSATIKKSYLSYDLLANKMRYGSHGGKCPCCSQQARLNAERADFRRNVVNAAIRNLGED